MSDQLDLLSPINRLFAEPAAAALRAEMVRRRSKREILRAILADGREHSVRKLAKAVGRRFGESIAELRERGAVIHRAGFTSDSVYRWDPSGAVLDGCLCPHCLCREPTP